jgi:hypothetical protein
VNGRWGSKLGWFVAVAVVVIGGGYFALRSDLGQALLGHWSFVRSIEEDHGTYYRLKVKLTYKGEPQDFDIVVGCNVRVVTYKDSSTTYEVGLVPTVFGRRMSDGKALVVRPPSACRGETTANGGVQPDLLPVVVVYDNPDTLSFGIAYLSEDAYESPLSALKFGRATIEEATRAEFDEFRRAQTNVVKRELYYSTQNNDRALKQFNLPRVAGTWAYSCEGYKRYRIPQEVRSLVQQHWPKERPDYWVTDTYDEERELDQAILPVDYTHPEKHLIQSDREGDVPRSTLAFAYPGDGAADLGVPTRAGGGLVSSVRGNRFPAAYYPTSNDFRLNQRPADHKDWANYINAHGKLAEMSIDFRGGLTKGFAYCYVRAVPGDNEFLKSVGAERTLARVDGKDVFTKRANLSAPFWIFERDEYRFDFFRVYLDSTRGDV